MSMTKREIVRAVLDGKRPPYVPWSCGFTVEAAEKLRDHCGGADLEAVPASMCPSIHVATWTSCSMT